MIAFTPNDFYGILHDIAVSMPFVTTEGRDVKSRRINTFAVTKHLLEILNSNSLGKDSRYIGKRLFYSTKWDGQDGSIKYEYPALFIGPDIEKYDADKKDVYYVDYSLVFADNFEPKMAQMANQDIDASRTFEEVQQTLRDLWGIIYVTLQTYVYAQLFLGASPTPIAVGWFSTGYLEQQITAGAIDRWQPLAKMVHLLSDIEATGHIDGNAPKIATYMLSMTVKHGTCGIYAALPTPPFTI